VDTIARSCKPGIGLDRYRSRRGSVSGRGKAAHVEGLASGASTNLWGQAGMAGVDLATLPTLRSVIRARSLHLTPRSSNQTSAHSSLSSGSYLSMQVSGPSCARSHCARYLDEGHRLPSQSSFVPVSLTTPTVRSRPSTLPSSLPPGAIWHAFGEIPYLSDASDDSVSRQ
jgi:hypothetical protein